MPLAAGPQLDQMQRLARVELEHVAETEREAERVRSLLDEPFAAQPRVLDAGDVERTLILAAQPRSDDLVGDVGAEVGRQPLPLAGEEAVALEVAEGAVVGDDLEPVAERLEASAGPVTAVLSLPDELANELAALLWRERGDRTQCIRLARRRRLVEQRREQLLLGPVRAQQANRRRRG